jgi:hypothetical protein
LGGGDAVKREALAELPLVPIEVKAKGIAK